MCSARRARATGTASAARAATTAGKTLAELLDEGVILAGRVQRFCHAVDGQRGDVTIAAHGQTRISHHLGELVHLDADGQMLFRQRDVFRELDQIDVSGYGRRILLGKGQRFIEQCEVPRFFLQETDFDGGVKVVARDFGELCRLSI